MIVDSTVSFDIIELEMEKETIPSTELKDSSKEKMPKEEPKPVFYTQSELLQGCDSKFDLNQLLKR